MDAEDARPLAFARKLPRRQKELLMNKPEKKSYFYKLGKRNWVTCHWDAKMQMYFESQYHSYDQARHSVSLTNKGLEEEYAG